MSWESGFRGWSSRRWSALSSGTTCILSRTAYSPLFIAAMWIDSLRRVNRTTLEDLSPFLLLRLIPNLTNPHDPFPTPEHRLSFNQRRVVKRAHRQMQLYNVGWRKNWGQVFGWERRRGWAYRLLLGGAGYVIHFQCGLDGARLTTPANHRKGDGRTFPRNPRSEEMLAKLADDLRNADKDL